MHDRNSTNQMCSRFAHLQVLSAEGDFNAAELKVMILSVHSHSQLVGYLRFVTSRLIQTLEMGYHLMTTEHNALFRVRKCQEEWRLWLSEARKQDLASLLKLSITGHF